MPAKKQTVLEEIEIVKAADSSEGYYFTDRGYAEPDDTVLAVVNSDAQASAVVNELNLLQSRLDDALFESAMSQGGDEEPGTDEGDDDEATIEFELVASPENDEIMLLDEIIEKLKPLTSAARMRIVGYTVSLFSEKDESNV